MSESDLIHHELTRQIIGAFYRAHSDLGSGFLEAVYVNAMVVQLQQLGLRVEREAPFEIVYYGVSLGTYRADIVVENKVIVEAKTGKAIEPLYLARLRNYLRVSRLHVGLLVHFGPSAEFKRLVASAEGNFQISTA